MHVSFGQLHIEGGGEQTTTKSLVELENKYGTQP